MLALVKRVREQSVVLLKSAARDRIRLHKVLLVAAGLVIAGGEIGVNFVQDQFKPFFGSLWVFGVFMGALSLLLEPKGEKTAPEILASAEEALQLAQTAQAEFDELEDYSDSLDDEIEYVSTLYETHRALMQNVQAMVAQRVDRAALVSGTERLLDIVVQRRTTLCAMGEEKWNFAVYLHNSEADVLQCIACRRWSQESERQPHRDWARGQGHTGNAFSRRQELVCANANDKSIAGLIQGPADVQRPYDTSVYVSIASIPVLAGVDQDPFGVIVATSDQLGRFVEDEGAEQRDTVEALRALANALAMLFTAYRLGNVPQVDSGRVSS